MKHLLVYLKIVFPIIQGPRSKANGKLWSSGSTNNGKNRFKTDRLKIMTSSKTILSFFCLALFLCNAFSQANSSRSSDSVSSNASLPQKLREPIKDSGVILTPKIATYDFDAMPKDPLASLFFSATLPGTGQLYNKEYVRGVCTGVAFFGSVLAIIYYNDKWNKLNTDSFYIEEVDPVTNQGTGSYHLVTTAKPKDKQIDFSSTDKALLITAITVTATSWIFGIVDSYMGANRYNKKLIENRKLKLGMAIDPQSRGVSLCARYGF